MGSRVKMAILLAGVAAATAIVYIMAGILDTSEGRSPQYITHVKLVRLKSWISGFYWQYGELPTEDKWKSQLLDISSEMWVEKDVIQSHLVDEWDNPVVYLPDSESFILYSYGKNQSDDGMLGDDIVIKCSWQDLNPGAEPREDPSFGGP